MNKALLYVLLGILFIFLASNYPAHRVTYKYIGYGAGVASFIYAALLYMRTKPSGGEE